LARGVPWSEYMLRTFICRSFTDPVTWWVWQCHSVLFYDQYYYYYYYYYYIYIYILILNLIERLGWTWISVFSVGDHIRVWSIFRFIILFYLAVLFEISVCPKGFLFWPLVGIENVRNYHLAPGWYREALICYHISFCYSWIINSFWRYDNKSHTLFYFDLYIEVDY
jgi:hypothetical protein